MRVTLMTLTLLTATTCLFADENAADLLRKLRETLDLLDRTERKLIAAEADRDHERIRKLEAQALLRLREVFLTEAKPVEAISPHPIRWEEDRIFLHAPGKIKYAVPEDVTEFTAVGELDVQGQVRFVVRIDGREKFRSKSVRKGESVNIRVRIPKGAEFLEIVSDADGPEQFDQAYWSVPAFGPIPEAEEFFEK